MIGIFRKLPEGFCCFQNGIAHGKAAVPFGSFLLVQTRQRHQRIHQLFELVGLYPGLINPFLRTHFHFQKFQTRDNHRNGGFQFMAGVGNKLLLPFGAFCHRCNGFFGAQHNNAVNQTGADNHGSNGVDGKFFNGLHFSAVIQKNSHLPMAVQLHHDVFIPAQKTISRSAVLRGLEIRGQIRFSNRCNVPQIRMNQGAVFGIFQNKIPGGKRSFRTEFSVFGYGFAGIFRNGWNAALIIGNHGE